MPGFVAATDGGVVVAEPHAAGFELRRSLAGRAVRAVASDGVRLVAALAEGLAVSQDGGRSWDESALDEPAVAVAASRLGPAYAVTADGGVWAWSERWERRGSAPRPRLSRAAATAVAVGPADPSLVIVGRRGELGGRPRRRVRRGDRRPGAARSRLRRLRRHDPQKGGGRALGRAHRTRRDRALDRPGDKRRRIRRRRERWRPPLERLRPAVGGTSRRARP